MGDSTMAAGVDLKPPPPGAGALRAARRVRAQFRFSFDGQDGEVVCIPPGNVTRLVQQLAATVTKSIMQIVPLTAHSRAGGAFSDAVWRSLANDENTDVTVCRLYLVPPGGKAPERERKEGRFQVLAASVRDFIEGELAELPSSNLWLIDDSVVVSEEPDEPPRWEVSARQADVDSFRQLWRGLWERALAKPASPDASADPLVRSADMMAAVAKMSCSNRMYVEGTCSWYHGAWQHLRLFNLVSSPGWHDDFYHESLAEALRRSSATSAVESDADGETNRRAKVLITGTADYSMLAYVLDSAERAQIPVDVRVVDQCRTPLIACQWYARQRGIPADLPSPGDSQVHVSEMDMLQADDPGGQKVFKSEYYDLIVTDAFLTRFDRVEAKKIIQTWYRLLCPGGTVVTTVHLHPLDAPRGGILDEVSDFAVRARDRAARWRPYIETPLDELTTAARQYATQMRSYDLGDVPAVRELFTETGFIVEHDQPSRVPGELRPATYTQLVARKPGG